MSHHKTLSLPSTRLFKDQAILLERYNYLGIKPLEKLHRQGDWGICSITNTLRVHTGQGCVEKSFKDLIELADLLCTGFQNETHYFSPTALERDRISFLIEPAARHRNHPLPQLHHVRFKSETGENEAPVYSPPAIVAVQDPLPPTRETFHVEHLRDDETIAWLKGANTTDYVIRHGLKEDEYVLSTMYENELKNVTFCFTNRQALDGETMIQVKNCLLPFHQVVALAQSGGIDRVVKPSEELSEAHVHQILMLYPTTYVIQDDGWKCGAFIISAVHRDTGMVVSVNAILANLKEGWAHIEGEFGSIAKVPIDLLVRKLQKYGCVNRPMEDDI